MKTATGLKLSACSLLLAGYALPAQAQFKLQQSFEDTSAPGWTLSNSATLTASSIDAPGSGWLRLTDLGNNEAGLALNSSFSFASNQPVVVRFDYVSWGGTGADGMTVFLYDSSAVSPLSGNMPGGGLGYCGGVGGYLGIGLDEYGNFSNPSDHCFNGGPGKTPESLVIRGPESSNNLWVSTTAISTGIDDPSATSRPSPKTVQLILTPAVAPAVGYTITAQFKSAGGQPFQTLFSNAAFAYAPPANLSVGFAGSTGGRTNYHELHNLVTATPDDLQVTVTGPGSALQGSPVTYVVTVTNNGNNLLSAGNAPTVVDTLPASITAATWTCTGTGGATCDASGTGNINTSNVAIPANGSVTYTVTGTLDPAALCGSAIANAAGADFSGTANFLDPDETNNSATVNSTVTCDTTFVTNPASLAFVPTQVATASSSQAVTLTEGSNGSATITSIAVSGDYSQTNDCPATLAAAQTCTVNVLFTPTTPGSRNGTLTIQSNLAAAPTVTSVVTLSGTGVNSVPSPFSFTPLTNVNPSSVQLSNVITVASTTVPAPVSVSAGGQYSINGGAFTSVPGVVSPGASVQVQLTAASGYATSDSTDLTIGGVSSTFALTTGAQPVIQGGFTPVTAAVPGSIQTSAAVAVTGTTISVPISVSSGGEYSIDGAAFTSAPGTVAPGDQVRVEATAPSTYNTTASTVVTIGGVTSTYTVATAAQPAPQAGFTAISGASISSGQVSNAVTVTSLTAEPISVSSGSEYSINGGPFTSAAGTAQPGDQLSIETTAPSGYSTTATATLNIGVTALNFAVTTGAEPVLQGSFTPVTGAANSSAQTSNSITVTGITSAAVISITSGAQYSIDGGAFTSAAGTVQAGEQVRVQLSAPPAYDSTATATLTIGGVAILFAVSTGPAPLQSVAVTGGGGAIGSTTLMLLMLVAALKVLRSRHAALLVLPLTVALIIALPSGAARADEGTWLSGVYGGIRLGDSTSTMTAAKLTRELREDGYEVTAAGAERGTAGGTLYLGYELRDNFALEVAGTYIGRTRAALAGVLPANLQPLLADTAHIVRGSGDIVALQARYRWPLAQAVALDLRAGPYVWHTTSDVYVSGNDELHRSDTGLGYTLGLGPRFALGRNIGVGASVEFFDSTSQNQFWLFSATLEYHFR